MSALASVVASASSETLLAEELSFGSSTGLVPVSRTYQLSASHDSGNYVIDPDNRLSWRQSLRRLDAEAIRDAVLAASGDLVLSPANESAVAKMGNGNYGRDAKATALLRKKN